MKPNIMTCPPLPEHLEIGQSYKRPCIRTTWQNMGPLWLPVIGSIHSDPEHVQADFPHVHVDYRFLTPETREELLKQMAEHNPHLQGTPSSHHAHIIDLAGTPQRPNGAHRRSTGHNPRKYLAGHPATRLHRALPRIPGAHRSLAPAAQRGLREPHPGRRIVPAPRHRFVGNRPRPTWCHHLSATRLEMVSTHQTDHHARWSDPPAVQTVRSKTISASNRLDAT